jgi:hypothetical protein
MSQIGDIEFGRGGLGVDENGEIYIVGPVNFYVARNIDEALIRMSETTQFDRV